MRMTSAEAALICVDWNIVEVWLSAITVKVTRNRAARTMPITDPDCLLLFLLDCAGLG